jgi:muramoyltetrapeptide carboxypeptidase
MGWQGEVRKPRALRRGSKLAVFSPASPGEKMDVTAGIAELRRLGFEVQTPFEYDPEGYFAASAEERGEEFFASLVDPFVEGLIAVRGGYGSTYLLERDFTSELPAAKCVVGYSDVTALQTFLWQKAGWVTMHGPMVASTFSHGAGKLEGYDEESFVLAVRNSTAGYALDLDGEAIAGGVEEGRLLGGCLTLLVSTIGTPWEFSFRDAIAVIEDRGMKPYQVDRALMQLKQAGKFEGVKGIVLGEFPGGEPGVVGSPTVQEVCERLLTKMRVPVIWGAAVGHTKRPVLTVPLGVRARLTGNGAGKLEILEPAVE